MEKGITISLDILGLLLAMVTDADWETENEENVATYFMAKTFKEYGYKAGLDLIGYVAAFQLREVHKRGGDAGIIIDVLAQEFGDDGLEATAAKLEEIEIVRRKRK
ncbi:hypothetical protein NQ504_02310 [Ligilactobacillus ruminis]|uniref:Uncharacterized protein n=1 Tax=Ligilactobacillus ruminis ATCC 25644 TaxID=525362 RepID=E7FQG5_9LACO|nr:hypothetical protein [Ligilactobacillus ruminis]EFZ34635.1 hypothetical protein HMPREF0542_11160 [Ligilactobacillus ruminis ATCC 25644]EGX99348.1 hypothetical protein ANHS_62 [Ligilactobacillus ruminis ATCC 25644]UWP40557.1 hypothetical protein NQ504_02310 [Ligilactobacillus ruminis]